jgi:hypothetical protein
MSGTNGDGPTFNGRPILPVVQVEQWARDARAPIGRASATRITQALNAAAFEGATVLARIGIRAKLSKAVADFRRHNLDADASGTDQLITRRAGRPRDQTKLQENIWNLFLDARKEEQPSRSTSDTAIAYFVEQAAKWVLEDPLVRRLKPEHPAKAASILRDRRRKQRGHN